MARNPFRSEAEAYRFLLLTVGYFALIVGASVIAPWLGLVVFVALSAGALWLWLRGRSSEPVERAAIRRPDGAERRILVIANETVGGSELRSILRSKAEGVDVQVLVVDLCAAGVSVRATKTGERQRTVSSFGALSLRRCVSEEAERRISATRSRPSPTVVMIPSTFSTMRVSRAGSTDRTTFRASSARERPCWW